ncbi:MAG: hypothetical protein HQK59_14185 [Deltaproteobacteria bacterium]|nr:hypothetical protein [Deltaproteobacteria bacterium]
MNLLPFKGAAKISYGYISLRMKMPLSLPDHLSIHLANRLAIHLPDHLSILLTSNNLELAGVTLG